MIVSRVLGPIVVLVLLGTAAFQVYQRSRSSEPHAFTVMVAKVNDEKPSIPLVWLQGPEPLKATTLGRETASGCHYVMLYSHECHWCHVAASRWLFSQIEVGGSTYPLIWLSLNPDRSRAKEFLDRHGVTAPAYAVRSHAAAADLGATGTPNVWIVSAGTILSTIESVDPSKLAPPPDECAGRS
jgi:hypothetical protein